MASTPYTPRVAIVTGAAQGIGLSIVRQLAQDGIDIAVNDLPSKLDKIHEVVDEIRSSGRKCIAVPADISSEEQVKNMVETTARELGSVDIMVANAGIAAAMSTLLETTTENFDAVYAVNIRGTFLCFQQAAKQMIKEGHGGRLIGASSAAGKEVLLNLTAYSASKFAIRGLTQSAAKELGSYGITANAYAPGLILTPLLGETTGDKDSVDEAVKTVKKVMGIPDDAGVADPEVVADFVSYICKPSSRFITGQTISVDGGLRFS
ncbi:NAD-binding protein [Schizopora paradoxa]|uniref:NAD-binding protein n=1 Tax=Schizopora paradoxa TaxID=27342 RepID=A0A0H2RLZ0_9AGAM|nr:NAD-binding protein [Schizopora paradoxa]